MAYTAYTPIRLYYTVPIRRSGTVELGFSGGTNCKGRMRAHANGRSCGRAIGDGRRRHADEVHRVLRRERHAIARARPLQAALATETPALRVAARDVRAVALLAVGVSSSRLREPVRWPRRGSYERTCERRDKALIEGFLSYVTVPYYVYCTTVQICTPIVQYSKSLKQNYH